MNEDQILTKMYMQPNSGQITRDKETQTYTEVWKGPWSAIKHYSEDGTIFGENLNLGQVRPDFDETNWVFSYIPETGDETEWIITKVDCDETQPAGDHGTVTITYMDAYSAEGTGDARQVEERTVWTLTWGATTRSPLIYAEDMTDCRPADILACKKGQHPMDLGEDNPYSWYIRDPARPGSLALNTLASDKAKKILNYVNADIEPVFHYPIVRKVEVWQGSGFDWEVGKDIDVIQELPSDMPFTISEKKTSPGGGSGGKSDKSDKDKIEWMFLKTGDTLEITTAGPVKTCQRTQEWTGAPDIDENFYGDSDKRWTPTKWDTGGEQPENGN